MTVLAPARPAPTGDPLVFHVTQGRATGEVLHFQPAATDDTTIAGFTLRGFRYTKLW